MSAATTTWRPAARRRARRRPAAGPTGLALVTLWLSVVVLLPLAALAAKATQADFWAAVTARPAVSALVLTLLASLAVAVLNAVLGTVVAWVLVRDENLPGRRLIDALIDLPFALPTIVAGIVLLALYGARSPVGIHAVGTRAAVLLALAFVTLPFVVRSVQPVLRALDREAEEAAASLGASGPTVFRRIVLPALAPAILSGAALSFARAVGEFGSVVLVSGNIPFHTQVASVYVFGQVESDATASAAAVSLVLLGISLLVLAGLRLLESWGARRG